MPQSAPPAAIILDRKFWIVLLIISTLWGSSFTVNQAILHEAGTHMVVALRSVIASVLIWGWVAYRNIPLPKSLWVWLFAAILGVMSLYLPNILVLWGQQYVPSGLAGILNASAAIFTMFFAAALLADEPLTKVKLVGGILGFGGLIVTLGLENILAFDPLSLGQLAIALGACLYGFSAVLIRRYLTIASEALVAIVITATAIVSVPVALHYNGMPRIDYSPSVWIGAVYLGIFSSFIAYVLMFRFLPRYGAGNLNLYCLLTGPVAIVFGAIFFDEVLSMQAYLGFGLIALGLIFIDGRVVTTFQKRNHKPSCG